jgi:hypothetical protein
VNLTVRAEKSFLRNLERVFTMVQNAEDHHVDFLMVAANEFLKRPHVTRPALLHQFQVTQLHDDPAFLDAGGKRLFKQ